MTTTTRAPQDRRAHGVGETGGGVALKVGVKVGGGMGSWAWSRGSRRRLSRG
jgi:hypothetical protein